MIGQQSTCIDCDRVTTRRGWRMGQRGFWLAPVCIIHGGLTPDEIRKASVKP
jgi:hypothetical protein